MFWKKISNSFSKLRLFNWLLWKGSVFLIIDESTILGLLPLVDIFFATLNLLYISSRSFLGNSPSLTVVVFFFILRVQNIDKISFRYIALMQGFILSIKYSPVSPNRRNLLSSVFVNTILFDIVF